MCQLNMRSILYQPTLINFMKSDIDQMQKRVNSFHTGSLFQCDATRPMVELRYLRSERDEIPKTNWIILFRFFQQWIRTYNFTRFYICICLSVTSLQHIMSNGSSTVIQHQFSPSLKQRSTYKLHVAISTPFLYQLISILLAHACY